MPTQLIIGQVVKIKGGGPNMTVESLGELNAGCVWFDTNDALHRDTFDQRILDPTIATSLSAAGFTSERK